MNQNTEQKLNEKTLYLFIDESGNFDFSPKGTKAFVLSGLVTFDPLPFREELIRLRYDILSQGIDLEYFHATEDRQVDRDMVFAVIERLKDTCEVHSVAARKNRVNPVLYCDSVDHNGKVVRGMKGFGLYEFLCKNLLTYVFNGKKGRVNKIIVVLSALYTGEKKKIIMHSIKKHIKENFPDVRFEIFMHASAADLNCQIADYCCWAVFVKIERDEKRPLAIIRNMVKSYFDIFKNGDVEYYQYGK
ncbi:MAG: DUF3800 domain-containing protein [Candidatus Paceibacterota bacterium]